MEGFPVENDYDGWRISVDCTMDEDDEVGDDLLSAMDLDFLTAADPPQTNPPSQQPPIKPEPYNAPVQIPEDFSFPFAPYGIQVEFMRDLYQTLEQGKVGIFESPTGTGKSLSLICGAVRWLKDYEEKQRQELETLLAQTHTETIAQGSHETTKEDPDWVTAFAQKQVQEEQAKKLKEEQALMMKRERRLEQLRKNIHPSAHRTKRKRDQLVDEFDELFKNAPEVKEKIEAELKQEEGVENEDEEEHLVADYQSDGESGGRKTENGEEKDSDDDEEEEHCTKIYYCSRTHSQLSQFVRELMKSPHGEDTRVISLSSRQNLCVNEAVQKLKSLTLMNDRCRELQKNKPEKKNKEAPPENKRKKKAASCPYYKQELIKTFTDRALVEIGDLEQLVQRGRAMKACPYYGTRFAVPAAQVVALPYNTLLHRATREACGIHLAGNIVIVDEAHNLADTISSVHSCAINGQQIVHAHSQLNQYLERYKSRLKAKNLMYIRQLLFILTSFARCLGGRTGEEAEKQNVGGTHTKLHTLNDFLFCTQLDNLNLFKLAHYCEKSHIARKLHGFVERFQPAVTIKREPLKEEKPPTWALSQFLKDIKNKKTETNTEAVEPPKEAAEPPAHMSSPLMLIEGFLEALTNTDKDGRIVISKQELLSKSSLKFILLNPAVHFAEIVQQARSVVVAGGTMQPVSEFKDQLFFSAGVQPERILEFSCGHVIPNEQLLALALGRGSSGNQLDFTYQTRSQPAMMEELGRVVYNVCNVVPGGVVVFFPSYDYEKQVYAHWEKTGFIEKIATKKKIVREPKKASQVDQMLLEYGNFIKKSLANKYSAYTGSVLFAVVGGKMSEGINFSDDLGRCVLMVGLPYPNIRSPELNEKIQYLNNNMPKSPDGRLPGQVYYENLCMKAVNQSIGRAIRHQGDYACILLLEQRYLRPAMKTKLPRWIAQGLQTHDRFGPAFAAIRNFFVGKKDFAS